MLPFPVASPVADTEVGRSLFPGTPLNEEENTKSVGAIERLCAA